MLGPDALELGVGRVLREARGRLALDQDAELEGVADELQVDLRDLLTGGDDYQTLFTVPQAARKAMRSSGSKITRIGVVTAGEGVFVLDADKQPLEFNAAGWRHFRDLAQS